jgi:hypothetical protein
VYVLKQHTKTEAAPAQSLPHAAVKLAERETKTNYRAVNSLGYIGIYQFGQAALKATGYSHITTEEFIANPDIWPPQEQEKAMTKLIKLNSKALDTIIKNNVGDTILGIEITKSGLLAAAHIAGTRGVKKFIRTNGQYNPKDKYGTSLSTYLKDFASGI